jgi:hypothetical protein
MVDSNSAQPRLSAQEVDDVGFHLLILSVNSEHNLAVSMKFIQTKFDIDGQLTTETV